MSAPVVSGNGAEEVESENGTFLGLDFSTQRLKAVVVSKTCAVLHEADVEFDSDLPEFRTSGGVTRGEAGEVTAPPLMWVKALDLLLERLVLAGADFASVRAVSGAAQQHGSVWWSRGAGARLAALSPDGFLHEQLAGCFACDSPVWLDSSTGAHCRALEHAVGGPEQHGSVWWSRGAGARLAALSPNGFLHEQLAGCFACDSPVWLDSSTGAHCRALEHAVGGPEELARITGSRAYERFTGSQIRKMYKTKQRVYQGTERISLVSSFACSLLLGRVASLDLSDASGMNLVDINTRAWHPPLLQACGDESLPEKLGALVETWSSPGALAPYYVQRYGFRADCTVVTFTGDNPSALAGVRLRAGWVALSLGTSDTLLLGLAAPRAPAAGHVLLGPTPAAPCMGLLCFSNGSLTRQAARDRLADADWERFNRLLDSTVRGNLGNMGVFFDTAEIVPRAAPCRRLWDAAGRVLSKLPPEAELRALLETQALARRAHAEDMGFRIDSETRLVATGGASANKALLQIFADVFNAPIYVQEEHGNAAVLGAAVRAADVWSQITGVTLPEAESVMTPAATPYKDAAAIYGPMLSRYRQLIATLPTLL